MSMARRHLAPPGVLSYLGAGASYCRADFSDFHFSASGALSIRRLVPLILSPPEHRRVLFGRVWPKSVDGMVV